MFGKQLIGKSIVAGCLVSSIAIGGGIAALAQDGTPASTPEAVEGTPEAPLQSALSLIGTDGNSVGFATVVDTEGSLVIKLAVSPTEWPSFGASAGIALYCGLMITILPVAF